VNSPPYVYILPINNILYLQETKLDTDTHWNKDSNLRYSIFHNGEGQEVENGRGRRDLE
jgi:hypothetical protein